MAEGEERSISPQEPDAPREQVAAPAAPGAAAAATGGLPIPLLPRPTVAQVKDIRSRWATVLQKASANQINVKNAWNVNQFESLPMLARCLGEDRDFHTSGVAIESAAKVFAYKVDALLIQAGKVQTAMFRGDGKGGATKRSGADADAGDDETPAAELTSHKRKRRRPNAATIASADDINMKGSGERQTAVDPLFAQTSSKFDQGGASGLLVLHCPFGPEVNILIDSSSAVTCGEAGANAVEFDCDIDCTNLDLADAVLPSLPPMPAAAAPAAAASPKADTPAAAATTAAATEAGSPRTGLLGAPGSPDLLGVEPATPPALSGVSDAGSVSGASEVFDLPDLGTVVMEVDSPDTAAAAASAAAAGSPAGRISNANTAVTAAELAEEREVVMRLEMIEKVDEHVLQAHLNKPACAVGVADDDDWDGGGGSDGGGFDDDMPPPPAPAGDSAKAGQPAVAAGPGTRASAALALSEEGAAEVLNMYGGEWNGVGDSSRWKALRRQRGETAAASGAAAGATGGGGAQKAAKEKDSVNMHLDDESDEWWADVSKHLKPAKSHEALLLARGKDYAKYLALKAENDDVPPDGRNYDFTENYVDVAHFEACKKANKMQLPEDHMVAVGDFFKLACNGWSMIEKENERVRRRTVLAGDDETTAVLPSADVMPDIQPHDEGDDAPCADDDAGSCGGGSCDDDAWGGGGGDATPPLLGGDDDFIPDDAPVSPQLFGVSAPVEASHHSSFPSEMPATQEMSAFAGLAAMFGMGGSAATPAAADAPAASAPGAADVPNKYGDIAPSGGSLVFGDGEGDTQFSSYIAGDGDSAGDAVTPAAAAGLAARVSVAMSHASTLSLDSALAAHLPLVARPVEVSQLRMNFAQKAKIVDIKRLKDTMWECLSEGGEAIEGTRQGRRATKIRIVPTTFTALLEKMQAVVPHRKIAANAYEVRSHCTSTHTLMFTNPHLFSDLRRPVLHLSPPLVQ